MSDNCRYSPLNWVVDQRKLKFLKNRCATNNFVFNSLFRRNGVNGQSVFFQLSHISIAVENYPNKLTFDDWFSLRSGRCVWISDACWSAPTSTVPWAQCTPGGIPSCQEWRVYTVEFPVFGLAQWFLRIRQFHTIEISQRHPNNLIYFSTAFVSQNFNHYIFQLYGRHTVKNGRVIGTHVITRAIITTKSECCGTVRTTSSGASLWITIMRWAV